MFDYKLLTINSYKIKLPSFILYDDLIIDDIYIGYNFIIKLYGMNNDFNFYKIHDNEYKNQISKKIDNLCKSKIVKINDIDYIFPEYLTTKDNIKLCSTKFLESFIKKILYHIDYMDELETFNDLYDYCTLIKSFRNSISLSNLFDGYISILNDNISHLVPETDHILYHEYTTKLKDKYKNEYDSDDEFIPDSFYILNYNLYYNSAIIGNYILDCDTKNDKKVFSIPIDLTLYNIKDIKVKINYDIEYGKYRSKYESYKINKFSICDMNNNIKNISISSVYEYDKIPSKINLNYILLKYFTS